ncbi:unnamed protein product, partial [Allacma fusca]
MKADGTKRYVLDLRRFNKHVVKNTYPLPIPQDQFDRLHGAKWFISLDAIQGFLQRMLDAKSRLKMAFTTSDGKFCMNRLPFGFINSPGEFQNMMDDILGVLRYTIVLVYIDDLILIFGLLRTFMSLGDFNLAYRGFPRNSKIFEKLTSSI